jgi:hypothetical protein
MIYSKYLRFAAARVDILVVEMRGRLKYLFPVKD